MSDCGTPRGYRAHLTRNEPTCRPCKDAYNKHRHRQKGEPEPKMTAQEIIEEIERLLSYGEGEDRIVRALGYHHRPKSLKDRLSRNGRADLNERIFWTEQAAA
jgi:hypothetical protein